MDGLYDDIAAVFARHNVTGNYIAGLGARDLTELTPTSAPDGKRIACVFIVYRNENQEEHYEHELKRKR